MLSGLARRDSPSTGRHPGGRVSARPPWPALHVRQSLRCRAALQVRNLLWYVQGDLDRCDAPPRLPAIHRPVPVQVARRTFTCRARSAFRWRTHGAGDAGITRTHVGEVAAPATVVAVVTAWASRTVFAAQGHRGPGHRAAPVPARTSGMGAVQVSAAERLPEPTRLHARLACSAPPTLRSGRVGADLRREGDYAAPTRQRSLSHRLERVTARDVQHPTRATVGGADTDPDPEATGAWHLWLERDTVAGTEPPPGLRRAARLAEGAAGQGPSRPEPPPCGADRGAAFRTEPGAPCSGGGTGGPCRSRRPSQRRLARCREPLPSGRQATWALPPNDRHREHLGRPSRRGIAAGVVATPRRGTVVPADALDRVTSAPASSRSGMKVRPRSCREKWATPGSGARPLPSAKTASW